MLTSPLLSLLFLFLLFLSLSLTDQKKKIKRPYFHVKPLERLQLKNWRDYLDFEISQGDPRRIEFLFERCVISCALYEDFWSKVVLFRNHLFKISHFLSLFCQYCKYAESSIPERVSAIYRRACTIHLQQKPNIHLAWAAFEEKNGEAFLPLASSMHL